MAKVNRNLFSIAKEIQIILAIVGHHTKMGLWDGVDGLKEFLTHNGVLEYLKKKDPKAYNAAVDLIVMKLVKEADKHLEYEVLKGFAHSFGKLATQFSTARREWMQQHPVAQHVFDSISADIKGTTLH